MCCLHVDMFANFHLAAWILWKVLICTKPVWEDQCHFSHTFPRTYTLHGGVCPVRMNSYGKRISVVGGSDAALHLCIQHPPFIQFRVGCLCMSMCVCLVR